jgi:hypothetical protein
MPEPFPLALRLPPGSDGPTDDVLQSYYPSDKDLSEVGEEEAERHWYSWDREWTPLPPFRNARSHGSLTVWVDRSALIVTGGMRKRHWWSVDRVATTLVELLAMDSPSWTALPTMNVARHSSSSIVVKSTLYVFGGFGSDGEALDSCEMLDLEHFEHGFVLLKEALPHKMANMGICYGGGRIYLSGGNYNPCCRTCRAFHLLSGRFEELPDLETECMGPLTALMKRGNSSSTDDAELVTVVTIEGGRSAHRGRGGTTTSLVAEALNLTTKQKRISEGLRGHPLMLVDRTLVVREGDRIVQYDVDLLLDRVAHDDAVLSDRLASSSTSSSPLLFSSSSSSPSSSSDSDSVESDDRYALWRSRDNQTDKHVRYRGSKVSMRKYRAGGNGRTPQYEMRPPPLRKEDIVALLKEERRGPIAAIASAITHWFSPSTTTRQHKYLERLEHAEAVLIEWLAELVRFELLRYHPTDDEIDCISYHPTDDEIDCIKLITRLYHRYVPLWKECNAHLYTDPLDVFVSHTGVDKDAYAAPLADFLRANGVSAFLDRDSLAVGVNPDYEMMRAMTSCRRMWCVVSEEYVKGKYPLRELMVGCARHVQEYEPKGQGFVLIPDCYETDTYRGKWMDKVLRLKSLKIYDADGQPQPFPTAVRAIMDESNSQRYRRIAAMHMGGGDPLEKIRDD